MKLWNDFYPLAKNITDGVTNTELLTTAFECRTRFAIPSEMFTGSDRGKYPGRGCKPRPAK
ncbi:Uncharacterized protein dnm_063530 [Desulfonema magnum]|uniref:Uncharacterized protein n=1 Tax=Desulfonema magnum TaxID=45655 RepID=A0A975BRC8_9BACT|nr:Uncharacterized protein dnm_063530 [Desulfonema magnum]